MVKPFQFARVPKIYFKNGMISGLPDLVMQYGRKILLVTGKNSFIQSDHAEKILSRFKKEGIQYHLEFIAGEPSPEVIDNSVESYKNTAIDLVVGIGGGSAIDAGKAISAMMNKSVPVIEYLEGVGTKDHPGTKLPFIAIPTTSGTGSEATKNAVISSIGKNGFKKSLRHDNLVPDIALVDPELTLQCPGDITAASGMDCFTQLTEAYLSDRSGEYTDALAIEGLKAIKNSLIRCYMDGKDVEARAGMSFAALTSGICIANAGLGIVHGFASSVGGLFNIPHGQVCGSLMVSANEINIRALRKRHSNPAALIKYATLGRIFLDENGKTDDYYIDGFIAYLHSLADKVQFPGLKKYGIQRNDIRKICNITENKNNPVKLELEEMEEILINRLF